MNLGPSMDGPEQLPKWDLPFQRSQHPKLCSWIGPLADEQIPFIDIHSGRRHWEVSWIFDCNICFLRSLYWRNLELLQVAGNPRESTGIRKLNHGILPKGRLNRGHQWQKALQLFWELNRSHCRASEAGRCWISGGNGRYNRYGVRSYWVHLGVIFITIRVRHHWHHALQNMLKTGCGESFWLQALRDLRSFPTRADRSRSVQVGEPSSDAWCMAGDGDPRKIST